MELHFPGRKRKGRMSEYYRLLKRKSELMLDTVLGQDVKSELQGVNKDLVSLMKIHKYAGKDGLDVKMQKDFEKTCAAIRDQGGKEPKEMTVYEFYTTEDYITEKFKKLKNARRPSHIRK